MALLTVRQQLEEVQAAITAVMAGQSYEIGGRKMSRADLASLNEREEQLIKRANAGQLDTIPGQKTTKGAYGVSFGA